MFLRCFLFFIFCFQVFPSFVLAGNLKQAEFAGQFYPDNKSELSAVINDYFAQVKSSAPDRQVFALIVPHAGYGFSGQTAAYAYNLIRNKPYKTVVVIGTGHRLAFNGFSVYPSGTFSTVLGNIDIDESFAQELLGKDEEAVFNQAAFNGEHSVEVELPFLQSALTDFKIVPVITGDASLDTCKRFAGLLKQAIGNRDDVLIVVSTDMYHGYDPAQAEKIDHLTLSYLKSLDSQGLYYGLRDEKLQLCGGFGAVCALILFQELGYNNLEVLNYTNSAKVTGDNQKGKWVVGYASCVIYGKEKKVMLNAIEKKRLLEIARDSIGTYLSTNKKLEIKAEAPALSARLGAFVTLNEHDQLRGCIGNLVGNRPLYLTVRDMAIEAATDDPRFPALKPDELSRVKIEISVLSELVKVDSADKIKLGVHGVLVRQGYNSGVFLPQVATETGWSKEEFLNHLCQDKAGIPADAWKTGKAELYIFEAEVFSE